jgi:hypothetical protein
MTFIDRRGGGEQFGRGLKCRIQLRHIAKTCINGDRELKWHSAHT